MLMNYYNQYYFMQWNPEQITKANTNSHLLNILTKRSTKSLPHSDKNWPGKHSPSLINILTKPNIQRRVGVHFQINKNHSETLKQTKYSKVIKSVPLVKMSSTSLSLLPTARSKTFKMNSTSRATLSKNNFYTVKQKNHLSSFSQKMNCKNNNVPSLFNNQALQLYRKESLTQLITNFQKKTKQLQDPCHILNSYEVDYKAFNFIDKVIDNPEKWSKFVHKKRTGFTNEFLAKVKQA